MSSHPDHPAAKTDGLWRWLVGGLAAGGISLGLLIAAYAIGYHRGHHSAAPAASVSVPSTTTAATTTAPAPSAAAPVVVTPALVATGKSLYTRDSCSGCHSLSGAAGAGPSFKGLAGSQSTLTDGTKVVADDAYLERSISDPDAQIVKGYTAGLMAPAIAGFGLADKPDEVSALVAFIKSQR